MAPFKAMVIEKTETGTKVGLADFDDAGLIMSPTEPLPKPNQPSSA